MSYILDALRRADAERERGRGAVPGLHTANLASPSKGLAARPLAPAATRHLPLALVAALLLLAAALAWVWLGRGQPTAALPPPAAAAAGPSIAPPVVPVPAAPTVIVAAAPAPAASPTAAALPSPSRSPVTAPARPVPWSQLSAVQRQDFPPLRLGGSVWSDSPAQRFVIVNGQVVREGETAAPGVVVERIEPRAVVLRWREGLVEMPL